MNPHPRLLAAIVLTWASACSDEPGPTNAASPPPLPLEERLDLECTGIVRSTQIAAGASAGTGSEDIEVVLSIRPERGRVAAEPELEELSCEAGPACRFHADEDRIRWKGSRGAADGGGKTDWLGSYNRARQFLTTSATISSPGGVTTETRVGRFDCSG